MISWDDVVQLAPALEDLEQATQDLLLDHVERLVPASKWGDVVDIGRMYLAAHLGTLVLRASSSGGSSSQAVGPVVSETVGQVSRTFAVLSSTSGGGFEGSLTSTTWGREYVELRRTLPARFGLVL